MGFINQGDIFLAKLDPASGHEQGGTRPVVVISGDTMNGNMGLCVVCPLTTQLKEYFSCPQIDPDKFNNLKEKSEVMVFQVRCVSFKRFVKKIGIIDPKKLVDVLSGLMNYLRY